MLTDGILIISLLMAAIALLAGLAGGLWLAAIIGATWVAVVALVLWHARKTGEK